MYEENPFPAFLLSFQMIVPVLSAYRCKRRGGDMLYIFQFLLYLFLFLSGMAIMKKGLLRIAENRIRTMLKMFTKNHVIGMLFGILITVILQSSSAVMIIMIGLIAVRVISFSNSIGIILGTNIGTTVTLEFLAYGTEELIIPLLIIGSFCIVIPSVRMKSAGLFFYGLGAIFLAMFGFEQLAVPISESPKFTSVFTLINHSHFFAVIIGCIITAIIQSSTAMIGIAMGFVHNHVIGLASATGIMLGANIGTCVDAYIASIGGGKEAKLSAYAHIWLNLFGVCLFFPFIDSFAGWIAQFEVIPERQLAHASVIFNVAVSLIFLPFANLFANFVELVHGKTT